MCVSVIIIIDELWNVRIFINIEIIHVWKCWKSLKKSKRKFNRSSVRYDECTIYVKYTMHNEIYMHNNVGQHHRASSLTIVQEKLRTYKSAKAISNFFRTNIFLLFFCFFFFGLAISFWEIFLLAESTLLSSIHINQLLNVKPQPNQQ